MCSSDLFRSTEAQLTIEAWRDDYNTQHPHGSLGRQTPRAFAAGWKEETHLPNIVILRCQLDQKWGAPQIRRERTVELAFEGFRRDDLRRWKTAETEMPQALRGVKFVGTEYQSKYPTLQIGTDIQVDGGGFIVAEPASGRQFLPKHYLDPIPLQQIQLSRGTLTQNPGW